MPNFTSLQRNCQQCRIQTGSVCSLACHLKVQESLETTTTLLHAMTRSNKESAMLGAPWFSVAMIGGEKVRCHPRSRLTSTVQYPNPNGVQNKTAYPSKRSDCGNVRHQCDDHFDVENTDFTMQFLGTDKQPDLLMEYFVNVDSLGHVKYPFV